MWTFLILDTSIDFWNHRRFCDNLYFLARHVLSEQSITIASDRDNDAVTIRTSSHGLGIHFFPLIEDLSLNRSTNLAHDSQGRPSRVNNCGGARLIHLLGGPIEREFPGASAFDHVNNPECYIDEVMI